MPYAAGDAHDFTHKANTPRRDRQWRHVYDSCRARGDDEGTAIAKASGVVKKDVSKWKRKRRAQMQKSAMDLVTSGFEKEAALSAVGYLDRGAKRRALAKKIIAKYGPEHAKAMKATNTATIAALRGNLDNGRALDMVAGSIRTAVRG